MEFLQSDEMFRKITQRYFSSTPIQFIKSSKKATKKPKVKTVEKTEEPSIQLPKDLNQAIKFKQDYSKSFPSNYDPDFVEANWQQWWEENKFYSVSHEEGASVPHEKRFVMILPPPNVTGKLHIGHALTGAIEDCIVRWKRMSGFKTIYIPGTDHAGIATQSVVEKQLAKQNISRHDLGREKFLEKVFEWKEEYGAAILNQLRRIGSSFDWDRLFFTMDEERSLAVKEVFYKLHQKKLIYRANRLINWSCALNTAISNIEVDKRDIKAFEKITVPGYSEPIEFGVLINFSYKVKDSDEEIVVSTTRIETMLGDVAVAVNSKDERYKHLVGKKLVHPFVDRELVVITDDELVDMEFGTGAVKVTPAHDPNDFNCGKRHNLEFINIMNDDGTLNENCGQYKNMKRYDVRVKIIKDLEELGLYKGRAKNPMNLSFCQRSGDVIEPLLKPQWYVDCQDIAKKLIEVVDNEELNIHPQNQRKIWKNYMNNIEDWCISRQLWWGHQIPAYRVKLQDGKFLQNDQNEDDWFVGRSEEEVRKQVSEKVKEEFTLVQDEDVLDTWFSSGILPFSSVGYPNKESLDFSTFFPNHCLETGYDILFFWVARMAMMSLWICGKLPFKDVIFHNIVRDENGVKMSKSVGNVIDPLEIINGCDLETLVSKIKDSVLPEKEKKKAIDYKKKKYAQGVPKCGSDAMRFSLLNYVKENKDINLDMQLIIRDRKFCNKIWNSYKFVRDLIPNDFQVSQTLEHMSEADQWIVYYFNETVKIVNDSFENKKYGAAVEQISTFWVHYFCDFYIEYSKDVNEDDKELFNSNRQTLFFVLENFLRLLHPVMPYLSEELYQKLPKFEWKNETISLAQYPVHNDKFDGLDNKTFENCISLIKDIRQSLGIFNFEKNYTPRLLVDSEKEENLKIVQKYSKFIVRQTKTFNLSAQKGESIKGKIFKGVSGEIQFFIDLEGYTKFEEEIKKINEKISKTNQQIEKLEKKMSKDDYEKKVSEDVREKERLSVEDMKSQVQSLETTLKIFESFNQ